MSAQPDPDAPLVVWAACCPGCGIPLCLDPEGLVWDAPPVGDAMCALCGTVTSCDRLLAEAFAIAVRR